MQRMSKAQKAKQKSKVQKSYRLDSAIVKAIDEKAKEQSQDATWIVETILGVALGVREMPKPLEIRPDIDMATNP